MSEAPLESDTLEAWLRAPASRCGHLRRDHRGAAPRPRAALVREHYATFVAHTEATYAAPLPRYVIDAFERYLACGDFSQGFVRCHCDACNHDVLVPFSCKQRGLCPSCGARRMCDEAANITDRRCFGYRTNRDLYGPRAPPSSLSHDLTRVNQTPIAKQE
jgi:hypothetical protein